MNPDELKAIRDVFVAAARPNAQALCDEVERLRASWDELDVERKRLDVGWQQASLDVARLTRERDALGAECDRLAAAYRALERATAEQLEAKSADLKRILAEIERLRDVLWRKYHATHEEMHG